jgi:ABC-2 type transport system permease protein
LRSEWIKLRTLRSSMWCLALVLLLTIGFGLLLAATVNTPAQGSMSADAQKQLVVQAATLGVNFTQLVVAVLGVLVISGEYTTGMIRSTFAAVPTRLPALFAKLLVLVVVTFIVGRVAIAVTAIVTAPVLGGKGVDFHLFDSDVMLALLGGAGYLALIAALAFGAGAILRNSAGGIASALGLILVVPPILSIIARITNATWVQNVAAFLPSNAGEKMFALAPSGAAASAPSDVITLTAGSGLLVLVAWVVVFLAIATVLVKRRDA